MEKCFCRERQRIIGKLVQARGCTQLANNSPDPFDAALLNLNRPRHSLCVGGKIV
jgi:hypothetical protein